MAGYKKYNGLDYRPKFSSSEKGRSREVHYVLGKLFPTKGGKRRKSSITLEDIGEAYAILFAIIVFLCIGLYKLIVWFYKYTKKLIIRYREKQMTKADLNEMDELLR